MRCGTANVVMSPFDHDYGINATLRVPMAVGLGASPPEKCAFYGSGPGIAVACGTD